MIDTSGPLDVIGQSNTNVVVTATAMLSHAKQADAIFGDGFGSTASIGTSNETLLAVRQLIDGRDPSDDEKQLATANGPNAGDIAAHPTHQQEDDRLGNHRGLTSSIGTKLTECRVKQDSEVTAEDGVQKTEERDACASVDRLPSTSPQPRQQTATRFANQKDLTSSIGTKLTEYSEATAEEGDDSVQKTEERDACASVDRLPSTSPQPRQQTATRFANQKDLTSSIGTKLTEYSEATAEEGDDSVQKTEERDACASVDRLPSPSPQPRQQTATRFANQKDHVSAASIGTKLTEYSEATAEEGDDSVQMTEERDAITLELQPLPVPFDVHSYRTMRSLAFSDRAPNREIRERLNPMLEDILRSILHDGIHPWHDSAQFYLPEIIYIELFHWRFIKRIFPRFFKGQYPPAMLEALQEPWDESELSCFSFVTDFLERYSSNYNCLKEHLSSTTKRTWEKIIADFTAALTSDVAQADSSVDSSATAASKVNASPPKNQPSPAAPGPSSSKKGPSISPDKNSIDDANALESVLAVTTSNKKRPSEKVSTCDKENGHTDPLVKRQCSSRPPLETIAGNSIVSMTALAADVPAHPATQKTATKSCTIAQSAKEDFDNDDKFFDDLFLPWPDSTTAATPDVTPATATTIAMPKATAAGFPAMPDAMTANAKPVDTAMLDATSGMTVGTKPTAAGPTNAMPGVMTAAMPSTMTVATKPTAAGPTNAMRDAIPAMPDDAKPVGTAMLDGMTVGTKPTAAGPTNAMLDTLPAMPDAMTANAKPVDTAMLDATSGMTVGTKPTAAGPTAARPTAAGPTNAMLDTLPAMPDAMTANAKPVDTAMLDATSGMTVGTKPTAAGPTAAGPIAAGPTNAMLDALPAMPDDAKPVGTAMLGMTMGTKPTAAGPTKSSPTLGSFVFTVGGIIPWDMLTPYCRHPEIKPKSLFMYKVSNDFVRDELGIDYFVASTGKLRYGLDAIIVGLPAKKHPHFRALVMSLTKQSSMDHRSNSGPPAQMAAAATTSMAPAPDSFVFAEGSIIPAGMLTFYQPMRKKNNKGMLYLYEVSKDLVGDRQRFLVHAPAYLEDGKDVQIVRITGAHHAHVKQLPQKEEAIYDTTTTQSSAATKEGAQKAAASTQAAESIQSGIRKTTTAFESSTGTDGTICKDDAKTGGAGGAAVVMQKEKAIYDTTTTQSSAATKEGAQKAAASTQAAETTTAFESSTGTDGTICKDDAKTGGAGGAAVVMQKEETIYDTTTTQSSTATKEGAQKAAESIQSGIRKTTTAFESSTGTDGTICKDDAKTGGAGGIDTSEMAMAMMSNEDTKAAVIVMHIASDTSSESVADNSKPLPSTSTDCASVTDQQPKEQPTMPGHPNETTLQTSVSPAPAANKSQNSAESQPATTNGKRPREDDALNPSASLSKRQKLLFLSQEQENDLLRLCNEKECKLLASLRPPLLSSNVTSFFVVPPQSVMLCHRHPTSSDLFIAHVDGFYLDQLVKAPCQITYAVHQRISLSPLDCLSQMGTHNMEYGVICPQHVGNAAIVYSSEMVKWLATPLFHNVRLKCDVFTVLGCKFCLNTCKLFLLVEADRREIMNVADSSLQARAFPDRIKGRIPLTDIPQLETESLSPRATITAALAAFPVGSSIQHESVIYSVDLSTRDSLMFTAKTVKGKTHKDKMAKGLEDDDALPSQPGPGPPEYDLCSESDGGKGNGSVQSKSPCPLALGSNLPARIPKKLVMSSEKQPPKHDPKKQLKRAPKKLNSPFLSSESSEWSESSESSHDISLLMKPSLVKREVLVPKKKIPVKVFQLKPKVLANQNPQSRRPPLLYPKFHLSLSSSSQSSGSSMTQSHCNRPPRQSKSSSKSQHDRKRAKLTAPREASDTEAESRHKRQKKNPQQKHNLSGFPMPANPAFSLSERQRNCVKEFMDSWALEMEQDGSLPAISLWDSPAIDLFWSLILTCLDDLRKSVSYTACSKGRKSKKKSSVLVLKLKAYFKELNEKETKELNEKETEDQDQASDSE